MGTALAKVTCCQPDAVSPAKVADASFAPAAVQSEPMCVPVLAVDL